MDIRVPLYHRARTGAIHSWRVYVEGDTIYSEHGQVDGQKILSTKVATGKNIGRSNETTPEQQAVIEAEAMHLFKLSRKYSLTPDDAQADVLLPMLAQPWEKLEKKTQFPIDCQRKLDGCRTLIRWEGDKVVLISRGGKPWLVTTHLNEALEKFLPKDMVLDGEIYLHGQTFQWITARTKKKQPGTELLQLHVYDAPEVDGDDSLSWQDRRFALWNVTNSMLPADSPIKIVDTFTVTDKTEMMDLHNRWVTEGYEGLIARVPAAKYEYGHRSPSLLKVKAFEDSEFKIVGFTHGKGIEEDLVIWRCVNDTNDLEFETRPRGTHEERRELFHSAHEYIGAKLKVRFLSRTESGLPRFPVGIGIRAEEDQ